MASEQTATNAGPDGLRWLQAAAAELLRRIDLHRMSGESHITVVSHEGGVRAVKIGSEEIFKKP